MVLPSEKIYDKDIVSSDEVSSTFVNQRFVEQRQEFANVSWRIDRFMIWSFTSMFAVAGILIAAIKILYLDAN